MNETQPDLIPPGAPTPPRAPRRRPIQPPRFAVWPEGEIKVHWLGERAPTSNPCDNPDAAQTYWRAHVETAPWYRPEQETMVVVLLNTRRHVICHSMISMGTRDSLLILPGEVFRPAIVVSAAAVILMHHHPSGDPTPSEADIKVTRDLIRAGQLLKVEVLDHVIMGIVNQPHPRGWCSLRELGYFYS